MKLQGVMAAGAALLAVSMSFAAPPTFSKEEQRLRKAVDDAEMCFHFAGEFNGDGSAHDKEVARQQRQHCGKEGQQLVLRAYRKNPQDTRLYPAVLRLDGLMPGLTLPAAEKARLCAVAKTELACP
ncbi:hypothetical protein J2W25_003460 [Variovorax boronicumulans]|uniref:Rap1a immunity protein domain-containing protein n=1 Tax=Variovorax boronicumulans TaxID=436515 RepID=A0AAW8DY59_9BURK|nr:hypothetical protein [Variovorax boronicumulans]MDP9879144.1 hypothetical protein [Variovorax boronicumulans]MDP9924428.1 hypothetical protein [Variovorax boronicumulans]